jgi:UDP-N-acetylglucosamine:LPS N-acetylglucosamine transferase
MNIIFLTLGGLASLSENSLYPDLLRCFQENGHQVYSVCQRERRSGLSTELNSEHGIEVLRVKTGNITKTNLLEKGFSTLLIGKQYKHAVNKYFKGVKFDLILYSTPPITIASTVNFLKKRDSAFTYLMLKDIFPQNAIDLKLLKNSGWQGIITKYFMSKEKNLYLLSDCIGCMSEANVRFLKANHPYLDSNRIELCPNTINPPSFLEIEKEGLRDKLKLPPNKIIFICGGNFGKPQDVDFIIEVLKDSVGRSDRHFVLCGSGTDFYKLIELTKCDEVSNVTVMNTVTNKEYDQLLQACDVGLIFLDHRFTIPNFPSRILDYMKKSMPIFAATDCNTDVGETILSGDFGWWCESKEVRVYTKILDDICLKPEDINAKGTHARSYLVNNYKTSIAYIRILSSYHIWKKQ